MKSETTLSNDEIVVCVIHEVPLLLPGCLLMIASPLRCLTVEGTISRIADVLDKADTGL